ncbi:MAG: inositol monophosphatase family protein [bacterium]|nr:inositol monophosphatase family protein [bacterium]
MNPKLETRNSKLEEEEVVLDLTEKIWFAVSPYVGQASAREITGRAASGDPTFRIDEIAEGVLYDYVKEKGPDWAYFSEDKGLVRFGPEPRFLLIVDPVDGSRPAVVGFEAACVSVALADYRQEKPAFKDIRYGCLKEIKGERLFLAEKGKGAKIFQAEEKTSRGGAEQGRGGAAKIFDSKKEIPVVLSSNQDIERLRWSFEVVGRPSLPLFKFIGSLVDISAVKGGCFLLSSSSFTTSRLLLGQLDAHVDVGGRLLREYPESLTQARVLGGGKVLGPCPYDIAASYLIAKEAGCIVSDAYGQSLEDFPLFGGAEEGLSYLVSANEVIHRMILNFLEKEKI